MQTIIRRQENLAIGLLDEALKPNIGIDIKLDVFEKVGKWVAIKNKLDDAEETDIDRFKQRIHGDAEAKAAQSRARRNPPVGAPEKLASIQSRLSGRGHRGNDGNSGDPGVEIPATSSGSG